MKGGGSSPQIEECEQGCKIIKIIGGEDGGGGGFRAIIFYIII